MAPKTNPKGLFDNVVHSALDFLQQSIGELETAPKYSIIHFWTSIELFFKARLLHEHWSLVVENANEANYEGLRTGRFKSTGFDATITRLKGITGLALIDDAAESFANLRNRRNQLVHFFHADYVTHPNNKVLEAIVAEQCRGWFYLHRLLTRSWKEVFQDHQTTIEEIHEQLADRHGYLSAKFDSLKESIQKGAAKGEIFGLCGSCGFPSLLIKTMANPFIGCKCLVCDVERNDVCVRCPNCEKAVIEIDYGSGICEVCEHEMDTPQLVDIYNPEIQIIGEQVPSRISCNDCDSEYTVIQINDKPQWGCIACAVTFDLAELDDCPHCYATVAASDFDSMIFSGCPSCTGMSDDPDD
jgi:hypothetical protein